MMAARELGLGCGEAEKGRAWSSHCLGRETLPVRPCEEEREHGNCHELVLPRGNRAQEAILTEVRERSRAEARVRGR